MSFGRGIDLAQAAEDAATPYREGSSVPVIDAEFVEYRLQEAGRTMMAIPGGVGPKRLSAQSYGYVAEMIEEAKAEPGRRITATPSMRDISRMDEALPWLSLIENTATRRIVAMRSIINPRTDRHVFGWKAIAGAVGCDARAVKVWHRQGVAEIVRRLLGAV